MRKVVDYCVIAMGCEMVMGLWDSQPAPVQKKFNDAVKAKLKEGWELSGDAVIKQGVSGGLFSSSSNPIISQTLLKYED